MAVAQILEPQDEVDLITLSYQETSIRDRLAYMVMMTKHGGDKSALAIMDMLKDQKGVFDGPAVDKNYTALHQGLVLLGHISVRSDVARQFLTEASDVECIVNTLCQRCMNHMKTGT
jgi:NMD protein affecting ribosome stability and mRNA decay